MRAFHRSRLGGGLLFCALIAGAAGTAQAQTCPLSPPAGKTCINGGGAKSSSAELGQEFLSFNAIDPALPVLFDFVATPSIAGQNAFVQDNPAQYNTGIAADAYAVHFATSDSYVDQYSPLYTYDTTTLGMEDGPYIQIPLIGIPVAIPVANSKVQANTLVLTDNDLCGIFSGTITQWGQTSAKHKVAAGAINVIYREDSTGAGTTFLLTQHLAAVCTTSNSAIKFSATNFFAQLFGVTTPAPTTGYWLMPPSYTNFIGANGLVGEAAAMLAATSAVGFLSPDYTSVAPTPVNVLYKGIHVAKLINAQDGTTYLPTAANTTLALRSPGPASVDVDAPSSAQAAAIQTNWVPIIPVPSHGYPVVGLTTWIMSQCYKNATVAAGIKAFLSDHFSGRFDTITSAFGYVPASKLAGNYLTQIKNVFLNDSAGFHLGINDPKACAKRGR